MSFNQFGFVDESDAVALNFELNCIVKIGTAPTCVDDGLERRLLKIGNNKVAGSVTHKTKIDATSGSQQIGNLAVSPKKEETSTSAAPTLVSTCFAAFFAAFL